MLAPAVVYDHNQVQQMQRSKIISLIVLAVGVLCFVLTITNSDELSAPAQFLLSLGISYAFFVLFDMIVLKDVNTIEQIVEKHNIAYAIVLTIPAILALAAAASL